jgi:hypothetical protein
MTTITTATQLIKTITAFNFHKTDEVSEWSLQGCKFKLWKGVLGYVEPVHGWFPIYNFNGYDPLKTAVERIERVLNECGYEYTYQVLDFDAYYLEANVYGFSALKRSGNHFIGTCCFREQTLELEKKGTISILSVNPIQ